MVEIPQVGTIITEKLAAKAIEHRKGKKQESQAQPLGMFDSGVGGLTVLSAVHEKMPAEDVIYLADTARVPYGSRTAQEIIQINNEIIPFLIKQGVKAIIMACGTSSAIAYPVVRDKYKIPIFSIIEPGVAAALEATRNKKIGLIATVGTIDSGAYQKQITSANKEAVVFAAAAPLFVPLIEGGFIDTEETRKVAREYLLPLLEAGIDTLILGCTHYPHLRKVIQKIIGPNVALVDPADSLARKIKHSLEQKGLNSKAHVPKYTFYTTSAPEQFEAVGSRLFGRAIVGAKLARVD